MARKKQEQTDLDKRISELKKLVSDGFVELARIQALMVVKEHPNQVQPLMALAKIAELQYDFIVAAEYATRAAAVDRRNPDHWLLVSTCYGRAGMPEESSKALDKAMKIAPDFPPVHIRAALNAERANQNDLAIEVIRRARSKSIQAFGFFLVEARVFMKQKEWDRAEAKLDDARSSMDLISNATAPEQRTMKSSAEFLRVSLYDKTARFDEAFQTVTDIYKNYPESAASKAIFIEPLERVMQAFSQRQFNMWQRPSIRTEAPLFIVGMPRSGTSLLEQILGMHSRVEQAGEASTTAIMAARVQHVCNSYYNYPKCLIDMTPQDADELQQSWLESAQPYLRNADRVSNKSLMNYEHLGIASIVLPGSTAVHIRRHPLDNCLSCHLTEIITNNHWYTADLKQLGLVYRKRQEIWQHWSEVIDMPMLEIPYECLTADQETWTRRLIDHIGLPWEDECLDFHKSKRSAMTISYDQVNKKMYRSSVGRWKNYEKHLGPLIDALGDVVDEHESLVEANMPDE